MKKSKKIQKLLQDIADKLNSNIRYKDSSKGIYFEDTKDENIISVDNYVFDGVSNDYFALICSKKYHGGIYFEVKNNAVLYYNTTVRDDVNIVAVLEDALTNTQFE